jgi:NAD(P)-dependent dehydrogenase (short-subunit alcohol dehydrogenase family)
VSVFDALRLDGKVAVVTGAGSGMGRAFAEALAEAGASVACLDVNVDGAEETAATVGGFAVEADVGDESAVEAAFEKTASELGDPVIVFANAGIAHPEDAVVPDTLTGWNEVIRINLTGVFLTMRAAARRMIPRGYGKIVSTSSMYGLVADDLFGGAAYAAAKGGVVSLTRTAATSLAAHGIRVNSIAPGFVQTGLGGFFALEDEETLRVKQVMLERTPLGIFAETSDLKGIALFLASPASDFVTGSTYVIDGGWSAG